MSKWFHDKDDEHEEEKPFLQREGDLTRDEQRRILKEVLVDGFKEHNAALKDTTKEALQEIVMDAVTKFGWFSLKTIGLAIGSALLLFLLSSGGWEQI